MRGFPIVCACPDELSSLSTAVHELSMCRGMSVPTSTETAAADAAVRLTPLARDTSPMVDADRGDGGGPSKDVNIVDREMRDALLDPVLLIFSTFSILTRFVTLSEICSLCLCWASFSRRR